jgi:hypothetical protein
VMFAAQGRRLRVWPSASAASPEFIGCTIGGKSYRPWTEHVLGGFACRSTSVSRDAGWDLPARRIWPNPVGARCAGRRGARTNASQDARVGRNTSAPPDRNRRLRSRVAAPLLAAVFPAFREMRSAG